LNETNDQKLTHIIADIERLLGKSIAKPRNEIEYLGDLGLTRDEAHMWLDQEPDYKRYIFLRSSDETLHKKKPDGDLTAPH